MGFDSGFELVIDGTDRQIVLQLLERLLDLDQLQICLLYTSRAGPGRARSRHRLASSDRLPTRHLSKKRDFSLRAAPGQLSTGLYEANAP